MVSPNMNEQVSFSDREAREILEQEAFELSKGCPLGFTNPPDCVLHNLRSIPESLRKEFFRQLSDVQLIFLTKHHCGCLARKKAALNSE